ncbi:MAG: DNA internalization-related competence protein ComEC/Rec2 [Fidelibacterota bacterium]
MSFSIFYGAGVVLEKLLSLPPGITAGAATISLLSIWILRRSGVVVPLLWIVTFLCGMWRLADVESYRARTEEAIALFDGRSVMLEGTVGSVSTAEDGFRYVVKVEQIASGRMAMDPAIRIRLLSAAQKPLDTGDRIRTAGEFRAFTGPRNPGDFDFRSYFQRRNVWGNVYGNRYDEVVVTGKDSSFNFTRSVGRLRNLVRALFDRTIGGDASKLMSALVVGLREEVPNEITRDFFDTGVIHILAVSGLHVGYVLVILTAVVKLLRIPYRWDRIVLVMALVGYAVLSGGRASVWRATIMASLYVMAPLFQREANLWNIIAASALGLLIYDPTYLSDAGFLLSFSAVISIVFFYGQFEKILPKRIRISSIGNPIFRGAMLLFIISLSAQLGTLPFTWMFFNRIPLVSLAANVIVVPLAGFIVSTGFAIASLGSLLPWLGTILGNTAWLLGEITFWLTRSFASLPFAYLEVATPSGLNVIQYVGVVAALLMLFRKDLRGKGVLAGLLVANLVVWPQALQEESMDVIFLDVGQGDAAIVRIPSAHGPERTLLVDAGRRDFRTNMGERVVLPMLKRLGIRKIDLLVMSHPHSDHIGGVEAVLEQTEVAEIWDTFSSHRSRAYEQIRRSISRDSIPYNRVGAGRWFRQFSPAQVYVLHPDSLWASVQKNINNVSIVLKLVYGKVSFLFVGDLEKSGDSEVVSFGQINRSNVLKVGHHGSSSSTSGPFLRLIRPQFAVVSVGKKNSFNHPSRDVLNRIETFGTRVLRTDMEGAIWFKSDGNKVWRHHW